MKQNDWIVLVVSLAGIVGYGIWKSRKINNLEGYFLANRQLPWYHIMLSVMATQASAITFLSAPGLGYTDGLRFVQFYFGLPLAMIVLCITFVPIFHKLNVYTAYEFLEKRFDLKTRSLTALLFLLQRGVSNGISIYAPSIVLTAILGINITYTTIFIGCMVMLYTVYGGTRAVSHTQMIQMIIIFSGLFISAFMIVHLLPENVGFSDALSLAGTMGKLNAIDTKFDLQNKYNIWSGIIGGFFLQLSYFGTDQSQVGRYLTGSSVNQSRLGLIMNGLVKIPMQFLILFIGTLVFTFYLFYQSPVFFNPAEIEKLENSSYRREIKTLQTEYLAINDEKRIQAEHFVAAKKNNDAITLLEAETGLKKAEQETAEIKKSVTALIKKNDPTADTNDNNYIFLSFITHHLPEGLAGLLIAIIFLASMGSLASGLNSLASTTVVDLYKRLIHKDTDRKEYLKVSRWSTFLWGVFCIVVALYAGRLGNLIEAVNILGSLFYGTILGIFVTAFYMKSVKGNAVFIAAILAECFVVIAWKYDLTAFLWLNMIGCLLVMAFSYLIQKSGTTNFSK
jgi:solute:Na+ symporter, SSS family